MGKLMAAFTLILSVLLLLLCSHGNSQSMIENTDNTLREENIHHHDHGHVGSLHGSHMMDPIDPSSIIFFHIESLKIGSKINLYFRKNEKPPKFIAKAKADSIPFSPAHLPELLRFFSFPPGSPQAQAMKQTLDHCEFEPIEGEVKHCVTSLESMSEFIRGVLGLDTEDEFKVLSTTHHTGSLTPSFTQNYTVIGLKEYLVQRAVGCHTVPYPYAVYHCHSLEGETKVLKASLRGVENGERVDAAVICHIDTSEWGADYMAFQVLGTKPGKSSPVCHIFPQYDFVSVPVSGGAIN